MLKSKVAAFCFLLFALPLTAHAQDVAAGKHVFNKCIVCHSVGPGAANKVGPELNGLIGRHSGSVPGYAYSDANKNSGIVWTEDEFTKYIKNPRAVVPGTKMTFPGLQDEKQIGDLLAFLKTFKADGSTQ